MHPNRNVERMRQQQRQQQQRYAPSGHPQGREMIRNAVPSRQPPQAPSRRTQYKSAFDTTCVERNTDVKEMLKSEITNVGDQDVVYRLHRGDANLVNLNRDPVVDKKPTAPTPRYKPGSIYIPGKPATPETNNGIQRPVVFQGTPTAKPTKELIGISDVYFEFDSFNKLDSSNPEKGLLIFDLRAVNEDNPVDSIIEMQIYPFFMPVIKTDTTYQPNFYYYRRLTIGIQNIAGVQFVKKKFNEKRWHFELEVLNAGSVFEVKPTVGDGKYIFTKPVRDLNIAEFRFLAPEKQATLPIDCFDVAAVNPADFGLGGDRRFETSEPHGLTIGVQTTVFFKNFNSTNSVLNEIINSELGHLVDVVSSTKVQLTTTPSANLLGTAVDVNGNPATARMCIGDRRIRFNVRFRRITPSLTNWISP